MSNAVQKFINGVEEIAEYYKLHEKEADYQDLKDALDAYYSNSKDEIVYNKLGIEVSGKLMIFRKVSGFKEVEANGTSRYTFFTKIKKYGKWVSENVECEGKLVFRQG